MEPLVRLEGETQLTTASWEEALFAVSDKVKGYGGRMVLRLIELLTSTETVESLLIHINVMFICFQSILFTLNCSQSTIETRLA